VRAVRTFDITAASNRLAGTASGSSAVTYEHDAAGNVVREGASRHFRWDHANRMTGFRTQAGDSVPSIQAQYLYDASGARVMKVVRDQGGAVSVSTYIGGYAEHHRTIGPGGVAIENTRIHVAVGDQRVACSRTGTPHPDDQGPDDQFLLSDNLGSVAVVLDDRGQLVNREEYTPFGETSFGSFGHKRFRFNGKERDEESGLYFHGARSYAPWLARWASADPHGPVDGLNLYRFARSNPLRYTDPDGTQSRDEPERTTGTKPTGGPPDAARGRLAPPQEPAGEAVLEGVDKLFGTADLPLGSLMGEPLTSQGSVTSSILSNKFSFVGGLVSLLTSAEPHAKVQGALSVLEGGLGVAGTIAAESGAVVAGSRMLLASEGFGLLGMFIMPYVDMGESRQRAFDEVKAENYRGGFLLGFAAGATGADTDWVRKELLVELSPFAHSRDIRAVGLSEGNRGVVDGYLQAVKLPAADREAYVNAVISFAARHRRTWNGFADDYTNLVRGLARDTPEALGLVSGKR
jgi:RHS repeat-associated protein